MSAAYPFVGATAVDQAQDLPMAKEWAWDFETDQFIYDGSGQRVTVEGNEAIKVWIYKAICTERYRYLAYSWQYGLELNPFIGKVMSVQQRYSELKRVLIECLMVNPYIQSIDRIEITSSGTHVNVDADLTTTYGEVNINV
ncbi:MAG: DUF2634 domain-containing protein [Megasphaera cerevisiae]|jgi:hypothetical protein|nr:DUF2634 domain-containing protein [Megasphaera cerevisiae]